MRVYLQRHKKVKAPGQSDVARSILRGATSSPQSKPSPQRELTLLSKHVPLVSIILVDFDSAAQSSIGKKHEPRKEEQKRKLYKLSELFRFFGFSLSRKYLMEIFYSQNSCLFVIAISS